MWLIILISQPNPMAAVTNPKIVQSKKVLVILPFEKALPCLVALTKDLPLLWESPAFSNELVSVKDSSSIAFLSSAWMALSSSKLTPLISLVWSKGSSVSVICVKVLSSFKENYDFVCINSTSYDKLREKIKILK